MAQTTTHADTKKNMQIGAAGAVGAVAGAAVGAAAAAALSNPQTRKKIGKTFATFKKQAVTAFNDMKEGAKDVMEDKGLLEEEKSTKTSRAKSGDNKRMIAQHPAN